MTVPVEIRDDPGHPEGGHALVLFRGAGGASGPARLTVEPLTDGYDYRGPRQIDALAQATPDGLLFAVGEGQFDQLAAGIAVLISASEAGLSAETLWPDLRLLPAAPRRAPMRTAAVRRVVADGASAPPAVPPRSPAIAAVEPKPRDVEPLGPVPPPPRTEPVPVRTVEPPAAAKPTERVAPAPVERRPAPADDISRDRPPVASPAVTAGPAEPTLRPSLADGAGLAPPPDRAEQPRQEARHPPDVASVAEPAPAKRGSARWPALLATGLLAFAIGAAAGGGAMMRRTPPPILSLYDALAAGDVSPLGTAASVVSPDTLFTKSSLFFRNAEGAPANTTEAAYWLKRALAGAPDDTGARRSYALMKLGLIVYGGPVASDHAAGRELLEVAGVWNNAFALCKLGEIAEKGDDVAGPDPKAAITWLERAKKAGCTQADENLARLKR